MGINCAGFAGIFTAFKPGKFAIEMNTRFPDHIKGNIEMLDNYLIKHTKLTAWEARKLFERDDMTYEILVETLSTMNITGPGYLFISGVK